MAFSEAEARAQFPVLVDLAAKGQEVEIATTDGRAVRLTPVDELTTDPPSDDQANDRPQDSP